MTSNGLATRPPRVAALVVELFASAQEADGILGDLAEEFAARVERDGDTEARRRYQRQAWRTVRDLALFSLIGRTSPSGITASGLMLTAAIGIAGLTLTWPVAMATTIVANSVVALLPVYEFVPVTVFRAGVDLLGLLITGVLVALGARGLRFRPMSVALAMIGVLAVVLALDRPLMMWLYGPPLAAHVTLTSSVVRWGQGVVMFGGAIVIGAAIGRMLPLGDSARLRPSAR